MNAPWFPEAYAWLPGTVLGCTLGLYGAAVGILAWQGKARKPVIGAFWFFLGISVVMLVAGAIAFLTGQPYGVWYGLGLAGMIGTIVLGANGFTIFNAYRRAEARKLQAANLG
jgi:hypothetical protein